jgi:hypothetical protein
MSVLDRENASDTPSINLPQAAVLGMHSIKEKPVVVNGQIVIRPIMVVALTYDHRLLDGREAVTFLGESFVCSVLGWVWLVWRLWSCAGGRMRIGSERGFEHRDLACRWKLVIRIER